MPREHGEDGEEEENAEGEEEEDAQSEDEQKGSPTHAQIIRKAALMLLAGTLVCAVVSDPMVDAVSSFSKVRS